MANAYKYIRTIMPIAIKLKQGHQVLIEKMTVSTNYTCHCKIQKFNII
jgi:hypothetical protein